jgi:hypothetical protein
MSGSLSQGDQGKVHRAAQQGVYQGQDKTVFGEMRKSYILNILASYEWGH